MIYLSAFWLLTLLFFISYTLASILKHKQFKSILEKYGMLYFIVLSSFAIMAIVTKDPVLVAGISIPTELQWLGSLLVTGFGAWRFYLSPLKERAVKLEGNYASMKASMDTNFEYIKEGLSDLKNRIK